MVICGKNYQTVQYYELFQDNMISKHNTIVSNATIVLFLRK